MLAFLLHDVLGVLQHLFLPQVKEVGGIRVELQGLFPIIPTGENNIHIELHLRIFKNFYVYQRLFSKAISHHKQPNSAITKDLTNI